MRYSVIRVCALVSVIIIAVLPIGTSAEETGPDSALFVVHFSTGANWDQSKSPQEQDGFSAHASNMKQLRSQGRIRLGARYEGFGMIIVDGPSLEAVNALIRSDPGVKTGIFTFTVAPISIFYEWRDGAAPQ